MSKLNLRRLNRRCPRCNILFRARRRKDLRYAHRDTNECKMMVSTHLSQIWYILPIVNGEMSWNKERKDRSWFTPKGGLTIDLPFVPYTITEVELNKYLVLI